MGTVRARLLISLACTLAALGGAPAAHAACSCSYGDGFYINGEGASRPGYDADLAIGIDGAFTDWTNTNANVVADGDNNGCDATDGSDGDSPGSTNTDLERFGWTWDATNLYINIQVEADANGGFQFIYVVFDDDNDGLVETGDLALGIRWRQSNDNAQVQTGTYTESAGGGDPIVSSGSVNGYALPGSFTWTGINIGGRGSGAGAQFETFVSWTELGVSAGSPVQFRVSTTSDANFTTTPTEVDHAGRCGGGAARTQYARMNFTGTSGVSGAPTAVLYAAHTIQNTGNFSDTFNLTQSTAGGHTPAVAWFNDADASGTFTGGDVLLTDGGDAGTDPDTGALAVNATLNLLTRYTIANTSCVAPNGVATVTNTTRSVFDTQQTATTSSQDDTVTVVRTISLAAGKASAAYSDPINAMSNPKRVPGGVVTYSATVTNNGSSPIDADTVIITDPIPANSRLVVTDFGGAGSGPVEFTQGTPTSALSYTFIALNSGADDVEFSNDGGTGFGYSPTADGNGTDTTVTHIRIRPKGTMACNLGTAPSFTVSFRVRLQ